MANGGVTVIIAGQDDTGKVFDQIEQNLKRISDRSHETESALSTIGEGLKSVAEFAGISLAVGEIVDKMKDAVSEAAEFGEQMVMASQKTGLAVETLSVLRYGATLAHTDFEAVSNAVGRLGANLSAAGSGDRQLDAVFQSIGVNAKELASEEDGVEIALKKVAVAMSGNISPADRLRLAKQLLGKAGADLIPVITELGGNFDELRRKAEAAGVVLSHDMAARLAELDDRLDDLKEKARGAGASFTEGLLPGLNALLDSVSSRSGDMDALTSLGSLIGRGLNFASAAADGLLAGIAKILQLSAYAQGQFGEALHYGDIADASAANADDAMFFAKNGFVRNWHESRKEHDLREGLKGGSQYSPAGDVNEASQRVSALAKQYESERKLRDANAQLDAAQQKATADEGLAILEDQHKRSLVLEQDYIAEKLRLEMQSVEAQKTLAIRSAGSINQQIAALQSQSISDPNKQIERNAKVVELEAERLRIVGQLLSLETNISKLKVSAAGDAYASTQQQWKLNNQMAADYEAATSDDVGERIRQSHEAYYGPDGQSGRRAELAAQGADLDTADKLQSQAEARIAAQASEGSYSRQNVLTNADRASIDYRQRAGTITTQDATAQRNTLNSQQADQLETVLRAYQALEAAGDLSATAKVKELGEQIYELRNPIDEVSEAMRDGLTSAAAQAFDSMQDGIRSVEGLARSVERVITDAIYKQYVEPFIQQSVAKIGGLPGIARPTVPVENPASVLSSIGGGAAKAAGLPDIGKSGARITIQLVNESEMPLKVGDVQKQGLGDKDKVEAILADSFASGGIMRQLLTGFGG